MLTIKEQAEKFFEEVIKPMFSKNIFCSNCNAENCPNNTHCIKCKSQL